MPEEEKPGTGESQEDKNGEGQTDKKVTSEKEGDKEGQEKGEKQYSETYVKNITSENARRRQHERELEEKLKGYEDQELAAEKDLKKANDTLLKKNRDLEQQLTDKVSAADRRFVISEARRVAKDLGMIDVDDVKAIDLADLRVSDSDTVIGLEDKIAELKKSKPHWFKPATDETQGDNNKNKNRNEQDRKKPVVTPRRKGEASDKDWATASKEELRTELSGYGVMV